MKPKPLCTIVNDLYSHLHSQACLVPLLPSFEAACSASGTSAASLLPACPASPGQTHHSGRTLSSCSATAPHSTGSTTSSMCGLQRCGRSSRCRSAPPRLPHPHRFPSRRRFHTRRAANSMHASDSSTLQPEIKDPVVWTQQCHLQASALWCWVVNDAPPSNPAVHLSDPASRGTAVQNPLDLA